MSSVDVQRTQAEQLGIEILRSPEKAEEVAAQFLAERLAGGLDNASSAVRKQLLKIFPEVPATSTSSSPELAKTDGREITVHGGSQAIEIQGPVNGEIIRAVLYAQGFGGRLARREENRAVVSALLEKEENGNINQAETKLLETYREEYVGDSQGGLALNGRSVLVNFSLDRSTFPNLGAALVVLPPPNQNN